MSDTINSIRIDNFKRLIEEHFDGSINKFATQFGISSTPYYMILKGTRPFGSKVAHAVETWLQLQPGQLDQKDCVVKYEPVAQIPVFGNKLSGSSNTIFEQEVIRYHALERSDIKENGWKEKNLCIFYVQGNSMNPELQDGHRVVVDTSQTEIVDNQIYAISMQNDVFIKRMFKDLGSVKLIARSENTGYPDKHFSDTDELKIIGRVVYLLGKLL